MINKCTEGVEEGSDQLAAYQRWALAQALAGTIFSTISIWGVKGTALCGKLSDWPGSVTRFQKKTIRNAASGHGMQKPMLRSAAAVMV